MIVSLNVWLCHFLFYHLHTYLTIVNIQRTSASHLGSCGWTDVCGLAWNDWECTTAFTPHQVSSTSRWIGVGQCADLCVIFILDYVFNFNKACVPKALGLRGRLQVHVSKSFSSFLAPQNATFSMNWALRSSLYQNIVLSSKLLNSQLKLAPLKYSNGPVYDFIFP